MKFTHSLIVLSALAVPLAWPTASGAQSTEARDLASNCFQCHGTDGRAEKGMPKIAGKDAKGMVEKMQEFRRSTEFKKVMTRHARGYTDAQLWLIGEYFESIPESGGD